MRSLSRALAASMLSLLFLALPAAAQTCVTQAAGSPRQSTLSWTFAQDTTGAFGTATGFDVLRATAAAGPFAKINASTLPLTTLTYVDSAVVSATTYYYEVVATNSAGPSAPTQIVCKTMLNAPPNAPGTLTISKLGDKAPTGIVTSTPPGISCGALCSADFPNGLLVTLRESVVSGSNTHWVGWGQACWGTATSCQVAAVGGSLVLVEATFTQ